MSLQLPYPIQLTNSVPVDYYYGPYSTLANAISAVPHVVRYAGLTVYIIGDSEYWWTTDLTDSGIQKKTLGGGNTGITGITTITGISAGGDLSGFYPDPTVSWINSFYTLDNRYVQLTAPVLYNGGNSFGQDYIIGPTDNNHFYIQLDGTKYISLYGSGTLGSFNGSWNIYPDGSVSFSGNTFNISNIGIITSGTWNGTPITDSYISSSSVWNGKQNYLGGTGFVRSNGGTISYVIGSSNQFIKADGTLDSNIYITGITGISAGGDLSGTYPDPTVAMFNGQLPSYYLSTTNMVEGTNLFFTNDRAISSTLTGYVSSSGTISSVDSIITAIQKLNGNIALVTGAVVYQGTWDASSNTPTLTSGIGTKGYMYKVSVAGNTVLDGITSWNVGDQAIFDGTTWDKIDGIPTEVLSVNGLVGAVPLIGTTGQIDITSGNVFGINSGYIGQTSISTVGTLTTGTLGYGINVILGSDNTGDTYYNGGNGLLSRLNIGATGAFYSSAGNIPTWETLTNGSVVFYSTGLAQNNSNFFWDNNNYRLGIGNNTPASILHIQDNINSANRGLIIDNAYNGTSSAKYYTRKSRNGGIILSGDILGNWTAAGYDGTKYTDAADIRIISTGTILTGIVQSQILFRTANITGVLSPALSINPDQSITLSGYTGTTGIVQMDNYGNVSLVNLTTTGISGPASFTTNNLNIPNYTLSGLGGISGITGQDVINAINYPAETGPNFVQAYPPSNAVLDNINTYNGRYMMYRATNTTYNCTEIGNFSGPNSGMLRVTLNPDESPSSIPGYGPAMLTYLVAFSYWAFTKDIWYRISDEHIIGLGYFWPEVWVEIKQSSTTGFWFLRINNNYTAQTFNVILDFITQPWVFNATSAQYVDNILALTAGLGINYNWSQATVPTIYYTGTNYFQGGFYINQNITNNLAVAQVTSTLTPSANNQSLYGMSFASAFGVSTGFLTATLTTPGSGYNPGTYTGVSIVNITGTGSGAKATVVVNSSGAISYVIQTTGGTGYATGNTFTLTTGFDGGSSTNFVGTVATVGYTGVGYAQAQFSGPILLSSIATPTSPVNGYIWNSANHIYTRSLGVTYQMDLYNPALVPTANSQNLVSTLFNPSLSAGTGFLTATLTTPGSGFNNGTYTGVALVNITGSGSGAIATVVVSGGAVTTVTQTTGGTGYVVNNQFTFNIGFDGGTSFGFVGTVATVGYNTITYTSVEFAAAPVLFATITTPTNLLNGHMWSASNHLFMRLNSVTYQIDQPTVVGTITTGTWQATAIGAIYGGTAQTTYTTGDILYASAANTLAKRAIGSTGNVLSVVSGVPSWAALNLAGGSAFVSGILPAANGGTGIGSFTVGAILYANTTTTLSTLADVAAGSYLVSGGVNTAPAWSTVTLPNAATTGDIIYATASNIFGRLADVAAGSYLRSGGVGVVPVWSTVTLPNAATTGDIIYASATNTYSSLADVATGSALISGGVGVIPSWGKIGLTTHITGILPSANGGTGINNGTFTITLGGNLTTTGAFNLSLAVLQSTTYTLPNTALETLAGLGTAQTWTATNTYSYASIGTGTTNAILLTNTTAAILGAQQYSPTIIIQGQAWNSSASQSQLVSFRLQTLTVQGTAISGNLAIGVSLNNGAYSNPFLFASTGIFNATGLSASTINGTTYTGTTSNILVNVSTNTINNFSSNQSVFSGIWTYANTVSGSFYNFRAGAVASSTSSAGTVYGFYSDLSNITVSGTGTKYAFYNADAASPSQFTANAIANTSTDQIILANTTVTTSGSTIQWSPRTRYQGHAWNTTATAADNFLDMIQEIQTVSGTSPSFNFVTSGRVSTSGTGAFTAMTYLNYTGTTTNFGINTTPSATIHTKGQDSTSSNYALRIDSSTVNNLLTARNDGQINVGNSTNYYANVNIAGATTTVSHLYLSPLSSAFSGTINDGMLWYQNVSSAPRLRMGKGTAGVTDIITALANQDFTNTFGSKAAEFNINGDLTNARFVTPYGAGSTYSSYSTGVTGITDLWAGAAWNGSFILNGSTNPVNPQLATGQVYNVLGFITIATPSSLGTSITFNLYLGGLSGTVIATATIPVSASLSINTTYQLKYIGVLVAVTSTSVQFTGEMSVTGTAITVTFSSAGYSPVTGLTLSAISLQGSFTSSQTIGGGAACTIVSLPGANLFPVI